MSFGMAKGFGYEAFCKVVKKMSLVIITGDGVVGRADLSIAKYYNVGINQYQIQLPEKR